MFQKNETCKALKEYHLQKCKFVMLYLAWDREINSSLFFCDVFVWKWGPRPRTSSRCYHGNKSAAPFKKSIFVHLPWAPNCMQNLKGSWKLSFPKMFDSYRLVLNIQPSWPNKLDQERTYIPQSISCFYFTFCLHLFYNTIQYFIYTRNTKELLSAR